ncbi:phosphoribosylanthranilate isomerase [Planotetraspora sp. GP83]|uniref:phosphoribosylanthranilate isomerase n=1 Tax=Planotetraspora sp. GP83 TaxID=3156264 RepID=UPI0035119526
MFVKICGVREPEQVAAAVEAGADAVGFVLTRSKRQVTPLRARELAESVPSHLLTVGVFSGESPDAVRAAVLEAGLRAVQLHGRHPQSDFAALKDLGLPLIRAVASDADLRCGAYGESMLIVDAPKPGSGQPWDWSVIGGRASGRWMLAGGLAPDSVARAIAEVHPWGVDVSSGVERDGVKDPGLIRRFVAAARS